MFRIILLLVLLCISTISAQAAQIVYPKSDSVVINSDKTFFIGNECPENTLKINNEQVEIHPSGGFFHPVKLQTGENVFTIDNGEEVIIYKITRPEKSTPPQTKQINYNSPKTFITKSNNVPLRSTPVDSGLNRLQHLEDAIALNIIGEYGNFYKVQLARDDYAWISKNDVKTAENIDNKPAKIQSYIYDELPQKRVFTLKLSKKVPYILSETSGLDLVVYNVDGFYENKYEFHINKTGKPFGYKIYYKNRTELVIEVKNYPNIDKKTPLKGLTITVDPGHGGDEYGAIGCLCDKEKDINLAISLKLRDYLQSTGANVVMTRDEDKEIPLYDRVTISNRANSDIFISIHNNAPPDSSATANPSGTSVYWFYPQSKLLAAKMLETLTCELGTNNDKVRGESFAVIRNTQSPAILIEVGYMTDPEDNSKLITEEFQDKAAQAILHGLENYLNDIQ